MDPKDNRFGGTVVMPTDDPAPAKPQPDGFGQTAPLAQSPFAQPSPNPTPAPSPYGEPPKNLAQFAPSPELPPPPAWGATAAPLYGAPPPETQGYDYAQNHYAAETRASTMGERVGGGLALLLGLLIFAINGVLIVTSGKFYPKIMIVAPPLCWCGLWVVMFAKPKNPATGAPPLWWLAGMLIGLCFALAVGVALAFGLSA